MICSDDAVVTSVAPAFDRSDCANEPIHVPGAIQPHGALIAMLASTGTVTHASGNLEQHVGVPARAALGRPAAALFGADAGRALQDACDAGPTATAVLTARAHDGSPLHLHAFRSGAYLCVDIEPILDGSDHESLIGLAQSVVEPMRGAANRTDLCQLAVAGLKRVLAFDRVMAYRFHEDGHGEVIAEAVEPGLEPYLGLRYPASDIPPQARRLYVRNPVGAIADSGYVPVALLVAVDHQQPPLDLTMSSMRSVSPVHCEYMRNMGTAASLTIGLADRDGLWGMLVCHHGTPRTTTPGSRAIADIVGQILSLLLQTLEVGQINAQRLARDVTLRALVRKLDSPLPLLDALVAAGDEFLAVLGATGALVKYEGALVSIGVVPPLDSARRALAQLLVDAGDGALFAVNDLVHRHPELEACTGAGSGALLLPRRQNKSGDAVVWFRPEIRRTVKWGGNPADHGRSDGAGKISPRTSFAAWNETVSGYAEAWTDVDLTIARELGFALSEEVARRARSELARLRHYDPLTGLANRGLLSERLAEVQHEMTESVALLFFDLDRFKSVNDTHGHAAGDALLVEAARRVEAVIGSEHFAARLGGDEFVILGRMTPSESARVAEAVRQAVADPFHIVGKTCSVAASIGVAFAGQSGRFDLLQAADMAMYASKQGGGNRVTAFDVSMYDRAAQEFELERDLRKALDDSRQLVLLYQPVYTLGADGHAVIAMEALIRWQHPRQGWLKPQQIMPMAERLGLMLPLGRWIVGAAVRGGRQLQRVSRGPLSISVNVSAQELAGDDFGTFLESLLHTERLDPATLCLEVTEKTLHDPKTVGVLRDLQRRGVRIAIDEFGIGYSSLSFLRSLPVDVVKLDATFLANVGRDPRAAGFVKAVIGLAHAAGLAVVVEGVEDEAQLTVATHAGADMAQGFRLAHPLTLEAALALASGEGGKG